ncbi:MULTISPECIES: hypothetical protein [Empedobacter]|uniref:hypothetical protein n=1 Tax=Empedobacter TaxID=59734 RepID=UPI002577CB89|nr:MULTISPECIES: hypothetical protein [Empedobacter]MDM1043040.1 hypothetical protein [Empedobacter brevis]MDM1136993.1 hypothetical protein [Empedobacter sp. R750]
MIKIILLSVIAVIIITTFIIYYKFIFDKKIRNFIEEGKFHFTQKNERIKLFHFLLFLITNSVFIILLIKNTGLNKLDIILFLIVNISFLIVSWWINIKFPIEHNQINIDEIGNSKILKATQTNIQLEKHYNILNTENNVKTNRNSKTSNNLKEKCKVIFTDEQLKKIYNFFVDNDLLAENNLELKDFKDLFLKKPIRLKADVPTLREFYNNLKIQKNVSFNKINDDFLIYFINSNVNNIYDYKQFGNHKNTISKLSDEIIELFNKF